MIEPAPTFSGDDRFTWHPTYQGQSVREVRDELRVEIDRDQRQYALSMEVAEEHEQRVLASVIELERRWSGFDFGWIEVDPGELADRIVAFEWERERRRELIPFEEYRRSIAPPVEPAPPSAAPWWAFWRR